MLLQLVRDIGIRDWVRGMRVEAWLGRNPSTRFLRQDLDSALHASISHFTGRELSHRRFSCDDPLSVGHFDSGRIARLLRLLRVLLYWTRPQSSIRQCGTSTVLPCRKLH